MGRFKWGGRAEDAPARGLPRVDADGGERAGASRWLVSERLDTSDADRSDRAWGARRLGFGSVLRPTR